MPGLSATRPPRPRRRAAPAVTRRRPSPLRRHRAAIGRGLALALGLSVFGGGAWAVATGRGAEAVDWAWNGVLATAGDIGFSVQEVVVLGRGVTDRSDLWAALGVERGFPIFAFDAAAARQRIMTLPWVRDVRIERRLPDALYLVLEERHPIALWQQDQVVRLIDSEGFPLTETGLDQYRHLPLVVGNGAAGEAASLLRHLITVPTIADRLEAAVRVGERRWDLHLAGRIVVRLPEYDMADALARLARLEAEEALFDRDILAVDLRLGDRVILQATPASADRALQPGENT